MSDENNVRCRYCNAQSALTRLENELFECTNCGEVSVQPVFATSTNMTRNRNAIPA